MENIAKSQTVIRAPRPLWISLLQLCLGLPTPIIAMYILVAVIISDVSFSSKDILFISVMILVLLLIAFPFLYFPQKYIPLVIVDREQKLLKKIKKREATQEYDLNSIRCFVSKCIKTQPGMQCKLILEKLDGDSVALFSEDMALGSRWEIFSEKISTASGKPLKKETWVEDYNGKLSLIPPETLIVNKRRGMLILSVPLAISFLGATAFRLFPTAKAFVLLGSATVVTNICISLYHAFKNRDSFFGKWSDNRLTLTVALTISILTLIIPYTGFYLVFCSILTGFRFPPYVP